ncbi:MAG: N-formylglutamate amidohydrolase, partial [Oscillospiraceae bacterium]|nr:N-formylglutamate amidohydrolase [Oscillospiraceae bacterium]
EFDRLHEKMKDDGVMSVISRSFDDVQLITFDLSRLLCDVERFIGDGEVMERYGMGFCYEKAYNGRKIKDVTPALREKTLRYYSSHHRRLDQEVTWRKNVLLIDLHSFAEDLVMPDRIDGSRRMPEICIGADDVFTPPFLAARAERLFAEAGFTVAVNYPYSGSMVPNAVLHGKTDCNLRTVMIEINKSVLFRSEGIPDEGSIRKIRRALRQLIS